MDIFQDLFLFMDGNLQKSSSGYLIFSLASIIFGFVIFLVDCSFYMLKNKSLLEIDYMDIKKIPFQLIAFCIGAGGVGFIGVVFNLLNFHIVGAAAAGISWPFIFRKILGLLETNVEEQKIKEEEE